MLSSMTTPAALCRDGVSANVPYSCALLGVGTDERASSKRMPTADLLAVQLQVAFVQKRFLKASSAEPADERSVAEALAMLAWRKCVADDIAVMIARLSCTGCIKAVSSATAAQHLESPAPPTPVPSPTPAKVDRMPERASPAASPLAPLHCQPGAASLSGADRCACHSSRAQIETSDPTPQVDITCGGAHSVHEWQHSVHLGALLAFKVAAVAGGVCLLLFGALHGVRGRSRV